MDTEFSMRVNKILESRFEEAVPGNLSSDFKVSQHSKSNCKEAHKMDLTLANIIGFGAGWD